MATMTIEQYLQGVETKHMPTGFVEIPGLYAKNSYPTHPWSDKIIIADDDFLLVKLIKLIVKGLLYVAEEVRFQLDKKRIRKKIIKQVKEDAERNLLIIDGDVCKTEDHAIDKIGQMCLTNREMLKVMTIFHQGPFSDLIMQLYSVYINEERMFEFFDHKPTVHLWTHPLEQRIEITGEWGLSAVVDTEKIPCRVITGTIQFDLRTEEGRLHWHAERV